jgi:hypothetical protein
MCQFANVPMCRCANGNYLIGFLNFNLIANWQIGKLAHWHIGTLAHLFSVASAPWNSRFPPLPSYILIIVLRNKYAS